MSALLDSRTIAEEALRQVDRYSPLDVNPDPSEFDITIRRLDMVVAELAGTERLWWLVPTNQSISLTSGTISYNLSGLLSPAFEHITAAYRLDSNGDEFEVRLIRRDEYEAIESKDDSGTPECAYIDKVNPTLYIYPVPTTTTTLNLRGQKYTANIISEKGIVDHQFPKSWQLCLVYLLAADIANGPVTKLPRDERLELLNIGMEKLSKLRYYQGREHLTRPRFIKPRDF